MAKRIKKVITLLLGISMFVTTFLTMDIVYALEENNIQVVIKQQYNKNSNQVVIEVETKAKENYEVTGIMKEQEERSNVTSNTFLITENGDVHFTVYYQEKGNEDSKEESKVYTEKVTEIIVQEKQDDIALEETNDTDTTTDSSEDVVIEEKKESTVDEDKEELKTEEQESVGVIQPVSSIVGQSVASLKNATDTKYFIFGKPNTITSYVSLSEAPKDVVIPRTYIDLNNVEQEIKYIGDNAFAGQQLTSIILNDNIVSIGDNAFSNNRIITNVVIPNSVTKMGDYIFGGCSSLMDITFSNNVNIIPDGTFYECTALSTMTIPGRMKSIGSESFLGCTSLKSIHLEYGVETIKESAFSKSGLEGITLPESLKTIGKNSFSKLDGLKSVVIPNSISGEIDINAIFKDCYYLTDITLGSGITSVKKLMTVQRKMIYRVPSKEFDELDGLTFHDNVYWKSTDSSCFYQKSGVIYGFKQVDHLTHNHCAQDDDHSYANIDNTLFTRQVTTIYSQAFSNEVALESVTLPNTLTMIENNAFYSCSKLKTINLPNSLLSIDTKAFGYSGVENIVIPDKVSSIKKETFQYCKNLSSVTIGKGVTYIAENAFFESSNLETVEFLGKSLNTIDIYAFYNTKIAELNIPDSVTEIRAAAFYGISNLKKLKIGSGLKKIENNVFFNNGLTELTIPDTVTDIGIGAFSNSTKLKKMTLGKNLKTIGNSAFSETNLTNIKLPDSLETIGNQAFYGGIYSGELETIEFGINLKSIGYSAFENNRLTNVVLPESLTSIGSLPFRDNKKLANVTIGSNLNTLPGDFLRDVAVGVNVHIPSKYPNDITGAPWNAADAQIYWRSDDASCFYEKEGVLLGFKPENHTSHTTCAQNGDHTYIDLNSAIFSRPITRIKDEAFIDNPRITKLILSEGLKEVGKKAFYNTGLEGELIIPDSVTTIGEGAFQATMTTDITIGSGIEQLGNVFSDGANPKIRIPSKEVDELAGAPWGAGSIGADDDDAIYWKSMDDSCFYIKDGKVHGIKPADHERHKNCVQEAQHTYIEIPDTANGVPVTEIKDKAFSSFSPYTKKINKVVIPDSVKIIGDRAFYYNSTLKEVDMGNGVESIGSYAYNNTGLQSVHIPSSVIEIKSHAFSYSPNLNEITFDEGVKKIDDCAVQVTGITSLVIPDSVETLGENTFSNNPSLESLKIGLGLDKINTGMFSRNTKLNNVVIPSNIKTIEASSFYRCSGLENITFSNGLEEINQKNSDGGYGFGAFENSGVVSITLPNSVTKLERYSFRNCKKLESITFSNSIPSIEQECFTGDTKLNNVILPDSIKTIENKAFYGCAELRNVQMSKNVSTIGESSFSESGIESVELYDKVTSLAYRAFYNCKSLKEVKVHNASLTINTGTFDGCTNLEKADLGNKVKEIGLLAFQNTTNMKFINVGKSLITIENGAFINSGIISFVLPKTIKEVNTHAFKDCKNLKEFVVEEGATSISGRVTDTAIFDGASLESIEIPETIRTIDSNLFLNSNVKQIYIDQVRDACVFREQQPWGASKTTSVFYRGEYIYRKTKVTYDETFSKATITLDLKAENGGYIKSIKLPNGTILENTDTGEYTLDYDVFVNGTYTFYVTSSWGVVREITAVVDLLNPIQISAQDAHMYKKEVTALTEDKIVEITKGKGWLILDNGIDRPVTEELDVTLKSPTLMEVKAALLLTGKCDVTLRTEGLLYEGENRRSAEKTVTLTASELFRVEFQDYDGTPLDIQEVERGGRAIAPEEPTRIGYIFTDWDKDFSNITEDLIVTAQYKKDPSMWVMIEFLPGDHGSLEGITSYEVLIGTTLSTIVEPVVQVERGWTYTTWSPNFDKTAVANQDMTFTAQYKKDPSMWVMVEFLPGDHGSLEGTTSYQLLKGTALYTIVEPVVQTESGWTYTTWSPNFDKTAVVDQDMTFTAQYKKDVNMWVMVEFLSGDHGRLSGTATFEVLKGTLLSSLVIPTVTADNGWYHKGWNPTIDITMIINENKTFTAMYNQNIVIIPEQPEPVDPTQPVVPTIPIVPVAPMTPVEPGVQSEEARQDEATQEVEKEEQGKPNVGLEGNVSDGTVPLGRLDTDAWALINLICTILTVVLAIALIILKSTKEKEEKYKDVQKQISTYKRQIWTKVVMVLIMILSIVIFVLTEDMSLQMIMIDNWTMLMAVITGIQVIIFIIGRQWKSDDKNNQGKSSTINQMN